MSKEASSQPPDLRAVVGLCTADPAGAAEVLGRLSIPEDTAVVLLPAAGDSAPSRDAAAALKRGVPSLEPARDGTALVGGHVYLAPATGLVTLDRRKLRVRRAPARGRQDGAIDSLLVSLAADTGLHVVGVIVGDTGTDGVLGFMAIKAAGGLTLAERLGDEAPASSSPAAAADLVLQREALAERIDSQLRLLLQADPPSDDGADAAAAPALRSIATVLRNQTGHDFHGYKQGTFLRRVQRRMQVLEVDDIDRYAQLLRQLPEEPQRLFDDLLIGVTQFFRDPREFELLEQQVIPALFTGKSHSDAVRVWVVGCSTGEEAYSIAILLREYAARLEDTPQVQIFATDIDGRSLAAARAGRYPDSIAKDLSPERLARWFVKEGDTYVIAKELREMCIFSQHSLIKDAPFSRLDLISCRNLLIYLDTGLQSRVIPLFHFALKRGGYLFLGNSENVSRHATLFAPLESRFRIFRRLDTVARIIPEFPFSAVDRRPQAPSGASRPRSVEGGLARSAERIVERYSPAYVIVDDALNVLHFSARMGRYIDPAGGAASLNLLNLVHADLRIELRAALDKAAGDRAVVRVNDLWIGTDGHRTLVDLAVEPLQDGPSGARNFVVVFKDGVVVPDGGDEAMPATALLRDEQIQRLDTELRTTRDRLQTTVEEYESTNEELKSANEEYQSLNEELQSANEELETSKEELQSVNEELTTVNGELSHRVQELARANSDLKNLLESTQIATIFLDNDLKVTNYTPAVTELFPLVDSDIGRPIGHIRSRVAYDELQDDVRRVLRTLSSIDREVSNPASGARYITRVLPYRSVDNFIGGAVVTFTDVTPLSSAQQALREEEERFRAVANLVPDLLWSSDPEGRADWFNRRWLDYTGQRMAEAAGDGWLEAVHPEDRAGFRAAFRQAIDSRSPLAHEHRLRGRDGGYRWFIVRAEPVQDDGKVTQWFGAGTDIEENRRAYEATRQSEAQAKLLLSELQHRVRNTLAVVRSIARRTAETSDTVEDYAAHLDGRLAAFSRVQAIVTRDPAHGASLEQIVSNELTAHAAREGEQVSVKGPEVRLTAKAAETFGLAVHELATNAVKYGAFARPGGTLDVRWSSTGGAQPRLRVEWSERVPDGIEPPRRRGFGTELIERMLDYELGATATLDLRATGALATIELPLTADVVIPPAR